MEEKKTAKKVEKKKVTKKVPTVKKETKVTKEIKKVNKKECKIKSIIEKAKKPVKLDKEAKRKVETVILIIIALLVGILIGQSTDTETQTTLTITDENISKFVTNYEYILNNYYKEVDAEDLIDSAIAGMIDLLDDPYSTVIDESESNTFSITLEGSYEGIGLEITKLEDEDGYMYVAGVIENSPAVEAGMQVGDLIVSINGKESKDLTSAEFGEYVTKGTETVFNLVIERDGQEKLITIEKKHIEINSVKSEVIEKDSKKIGYIYISIFASNTKDQFEEALTELENKNIDGLIIDVRSNSGGHLTSVDGILDMFLNSKQIMYQFQTNKKVEKTYGTGNETKKSYEIVLLGNESSASASEVLIAGLRDNFNYKFIGKKTYGKGSVQEMMSVSSDLKIKITTKSWLTPNGLNLTEEEGITPDIEVTMDDKYYETYSTDDDNQLQRAIEYIVNGK